MLQCLKMLANLGPPESTRDYATRLQIPTERKLQELCSPQAATEAMSAEEKDEKDGDSSVSPTDLMRDAIQKGREEIEKHGEVVREAIQKGREEIEKHGEEAW